MISQQTFHIEIDEGSDYSKVFNLIDESTGIPTNLTGYSARMDVRGLDYNSQFSVIIPITYNSTASTTSRGITLGGALGTVSLAIPASDTLSGSWYGGTNGTYDIFLIDSAGRRTRFVKGFFTINPSSTRIPLV